MLGTGEFTTAICAIVFEAISSRFALTSWLRDGVDEKGISRMRERGTLREERRTGGVLARRSARVKRTWAGGPETEKLEGWSAEGAEGWSGDGRG